MENYIQQAQDFLEQTQSTLTIDRIPAFLYERPLWDDTASDNTRASYKITLKNHKGSLSFTFWDSIHNTTAKTFPKKPTSYDILACLDTYALGQSFNDWCTSYGYDTDSRKAYQTYTELIKQAQTLSEMYTDEELQKLNDIQ